MAKAVRKVRKSSRRKSAGRSVHATARHACRGQGAYVSEVPDRIRRLINSSLEMDEVLNLSMQLMEKTLGATASSILLHDAGTNELKFYLATGDKKESPWNRQTLVRR